MRSNIGAFSLKERLVRAKEEYSYFINHKIFGRDLQRLTRKIESVIGQPGPGNPMEYSRTPYGSGLQLYLGTYLSYDFKSLRNVTDDHEFEDKIRSIVEGQSYLEDFVRSVISAMQKAKIDIEKLTVDPGENLETKQDILSILSQDIDEFEAFLNEKETQQLGAVTQGLEGQVQEKDQRIQQLEKAQETMRSELDKYKRLFLQATNKLKTSQDLLEKVLFESAKSVAPAPTSTIPSVETPTTSQLEDENPGLSLSLNRSRF